MIRTFALLLLLVLAPRPADCTPLRPGEIGVFYDRAATWRIGDIPAFIPFYVCARLDAAGISAARYRLEAWTPEGYVSTIADVDLQVSDLVADANGVVVLNTHFHRVFNERPYLRIVPYGGVERSAQITSAAPGALSRPLNWRNPHWRGDLTRTVPLGDPTLGVWKVASVIATHAGADAGDMATIGAHLVYFGMASGDFDNYDDDFDPNFASQDIDEWCGPGGGAVCCVCYPQDWVQTRFDWDPNVASFSGIRVGEDQSDASLSILDQGPGFVVARIDRPGAIHFFDQVFRLDLLLDGTPTMTEVSLTSTSSGLFEGVDFIADSPLGSRHPGKVFVDCEFHDVLDDDIIDALDVRASLDLMLSDGPVEDGQLCRADIDFDGELEPGDAVRTARAAQGLGVAEPSVVGGGVLVSLTGETLVVDTTDLAGIRVSMDTSLPAGAALVVVSGAGEASARVHAGGRLEIVFAQVDTAPAQVQVTATGGDFGAPQLVAAKGYDASGAGVATTSGTTAAPDLPRAALSVGSAFPNPFNPKVTIPYMAHRPVQMRVRILDAKGRYVVDLGERVVEAGPGSIVWVGQDAAGKHVASGVYRVCFVTEEGETVERVTLLK